MIRRDGVEHTSPFGEVAEVELNLCARGVSNQCNPAVSGIQAGRIQHEVEDEVQFTLNVFRIEIVGLIQHDRKIDTLSTRCRNTTDSQTREFLHTRLIQLSFTVHRLTPGTWIAKRSSVAVIADRTSYDVRYTSKLSNGFQL